jgi:hypothetical protein
MIALPDGSSIYYIVKKYASAGIAAACFAYTSYQTVSKEVLKFMG